MFTYDMGGHMQPMHDLAFPAKDKHHIAADDFASHSAAMTSPG